MMTSENPPTRNHWLWWLLSGLALSGALLAVVLYYYGGHLLEGWRQLTQYLHEREKIRYLLKEAGPFGPLVFVTVQALQVVLAPIPGEATGFLGGFLFGAPLGFLYSSIGLTLGSMLAFLLGHLLEEKFVVKVVSPETMQRFDFLMEHQGALVAFFLFLLPGFPKDYLCFLLGLSPLSFRVFAVLVAVGRMPGTLMLSLQGANIYEGDYLSFAVILALCLVVGGLLYYYRETLYVWIRRLEGKPFEEKSPEKP
jgi:uncharacterized membrane protein YdjX (TVP38/TMEM64 family)